MLLTPRPGPRKAMKRKVVGVKVSFEVYPPRDPSDSSALENAIIKLSEVDPEFISVTFGAGGSSTKNSLEVLKFIRDNSSAKPLAHLTCVGTRRSEARELIEEFLREGIQDFLALRGDLPPGHKPHSDELYQADQLVELIRSLGGAESVAVAAFPNGHPESGTERQDLDALLSKQEKGADFAISQLFFYVEDYLEFLDLARAKGVTIPIVPGLMPIVSIPRLRRVLELTGEREPVELVDRLSAADSGEERREIGINWSANQIRSLVEAGVEHVHLYAFNEYKNVTEVLKRSGVR